MKQNHTLKQYYQKEYLHQNKLLQLHKFDSHQNAPHHHGEYVLHLQMRKKHKKILVI